MEKKPLVSEIKFSSYHALLTEIVSTGMFFLSMTWDLCAPRVFSSSSDCLEALVCLPAFFWDHQLHISLVFGYQSSAKPQIFHSTLDPTEGCLQWNVWGKEFWVELMGILYKIESRYITRLGRNKNATLFMSRWIKYVACFHLFLGKYVLW